MELNLEIKWGTDFQTKTYTTQFPRHQAKTVRRRNHRHLSDRAGGGNPGRRRRSHAGAVVWFVAGSGRVVTHGGFGGSGGIAILY